MNPIEKTIRNALEKGDPGDRAFREKIYRSVHSALERSMENNPDLPVAAVLQRREMLKESIRSVESEFIPAAMSSPEAPAPREEPALPPQAEIAPDDEDEPAGEMPVPPVEAADGEADGFGAPATETLEHEPDRPEPPDFPVVEPRLPREERRGYASEPRPRVDGRRREPGRREPSFGDGDAQDRFPPADGDAVSAELRGERRALPRRRGRIYAIAFLAVTLLAAIGMGVWWTIDQRLFLSPLESDTSVPNPPLALEDEEFAPDDTSPLPPLTGAPGDTTQWIVIFDPSDPTGVAVPPGGEAAVVDTEGGPVLRILTASADEPVVFDVGQGVLDRIAGRRAVFNIIAASEEGQPTQMSVTCDFANLGDCGRKRYDVTAEHTDFLFNLEIPAGEPSGAGTIAIVSDVADRGRALGISGIRVSIAD